jgi:Flp pilus assembly protein TadD
MVVTLPFVLLLLDFWPFRRLALSSTHSESHRPGVPRFDAFPLRRFAAYAASSFPLIREKIPFFVLSFLASIMTFRAQSQGGAVASFSGVPLASRIANAAVSYLRYLFETFWPVNLSPIYVHPGPWPPATILGSVLVLVLVTVIVSAAGRRNPYLFVGWFWFLGVLVPALGLVQVGPQAMADRYLYLPGIGLYIALVWTAFELAGGRAKVPSPLLDQTANAHPAAFFPAPSNRLVRIVVLLGIVALAGCMLCTWFQVQYWRNGRTLYQHALAIDPNNYVACDYLGKALLDEGRDQDALALFRNSVRLESGYSEAQYNLGTLLLTHGLVDEAVRPLERAVKLTPGDGNAHHQLANAYLQLGRLAEAADEYVRALAIKPADAGVCASLGTVLLRQGNLPEAAARFSQALGLEPNHVEAHRNLGVVLVMQGKGSEAILQFGEAVRLKPADPDLRFNLGLALLENNRPREAEQQFLEILQLKPDDSRAHFRLAAALREQRKSSGAVAHYRQTLRLNPDFPEALNELAWILATDPDPGVRNGTEAVSLAKKACNLTKDAQPAMLFTLAAACAENGEFAEAIAAAQKAHLLAENSGQTNVVSKSDAALKQFQATQPLRDEHSFP